MIVHDKSTNDNWRHNSKTVIADVALWTWKTHWLKNYIKQVLINWSQKAALATPNFIVENYCGLLRWPQITKFLKVQITKVHKK